MLSSKPALNPAALVGCLSVPSPRRPETPSSKGVLPPCDVLFARTTVWFVYDQGAPEDVASVQFSFMSAPLKLPAPSATADCPVKVFASGESEMS